MRTVLLALLITVFASVALGYFSIESGAVVHASWYEAEYSSEPWIAPGLSLAGIYELSDRSSLGLTGEFVMIGLDNYAGLATLDYRLVAYRMTNSALQLGVAFGLLLDTIPGGTGLIEDWDTHLHLALGPRLVALGEITNRLDFKVTLTGLFVGLYLSDYPSEMPVLDYLTLGVSIAYVF